MHAYYYKYYWKINECRKDVSIVCGFHQKTMMKKTIQMIGFISASVVIFSARFSVMNWPGVSYMKLIV